METKTSELGPDVGTAERLIESIHSKKRVQGYTHEFYRYPACFSPEFARAVVETFSDPGDTVLDPFMGGGTTVVEGLLLGRRVVGVDLNSLAAFVTRVKSTPLSSKELSYVRLFIDRFSKYPPSIRHIKRGEYSVAAWKNTPWWIRNCILATTSELGGIKNRRVFNFLRCGLLKASQWALDCRDEIPSSRQFFREFCAIVSEMCEGMEEYKAALHRSKVPVSNNISRFRRILNRSAIGVDGDKRIPRSWLPARLVVTSPPYPGVHVLYNRWQVRGRRETRAAYEIIGSPDGLPSSHFRFSPRSRSSKDVPKRYFKVLSSAYGSIARLLTKESLLVQLVSFSHPESQLGPFLDAMAIAGFEEYQQKELGLVDEGRIVRSVPGRKWYTHLGEDLPAGKELLLLHRLRELR